MEKWRRRREEDGAERGKRPLEYLYVAGCLFGSAWLAADIYSFAKFNESILSPSSLSSRLHSKNLW